MLLYCEKTRGFLEWKEGKWVDSEGREYPMYYCECFGRRCEKDKALVDIMMVKPKSKVINRCSPMVLSRKELSFPLDAGDIYKEYLDARSKGIEITSINIHLEGKRFEICGVPVSLVLELV